ncbi:MAG TPA: LemA family protein, partial [Marmoricola sp.]|nr:LemA family protein [Marmoricola sp.]
AAAQAGNVGEKAAADAELSKALVNVIAVAEAYPDLKANTQFLDLQRQLADTENQLAFARQYYNDAVTKLNSMTQTVPWMFLTGMAGVSKREFYKAPEGQQAPPTVDFGTGPSAPGAPAAPGQLPAPAPYTGSDAPITQPNQAPANPLDP